MQLQLGHQSLLYNGARHVHCTGLWKAATGPLLSGCELAIAANARRKCGGWLLFLRP